ncbi:alpha/beta hydrolase [Devosia sp. XK-2]|uniref:alpha/beta fold hydrolase n=1 Tax=Devosia sp. XK-2 TaxID=3126689 RepID=UPI0030D4239B
MIYKTDEGRAFVLRHYRAVLDAWPVQSRETSISTRQGETFILTSGPDKGPPLILLHGSATNSASWVGDIGTWSQHFRVHAIDLIGEPGLSAPSRPPLGSGAYQEWLDDVLDGLGLQQAAVIGLSLGGWVAMDYAIRRPDRVGKLVLISPGGIGRNRNILLWALPLLLLGAWGRRKMQARIGGKALLDPAFATSPLGVMSDTIFAHFNPRTERLPTPSDAELQALPMPVMALLGGKDVFIDAAETRMRLERNVRNLTMRYLPEGLHFMPEQTAAVDAFLLA